MSGDGSTLVGYDSYYHNGQRNAAYTFKQGAGKTILEDLNKGKYGSVALGTNFDRSVVVGYSSDHKNNHEFRATVWINSAIRSLGILPPQEIKKSRTHMCFTNSEAIATNHDGSVTIGYCHVGSGKAMTGFIHTLERGMESLGSLKKSGFGSRPTATNWDGNVIVGWSKIKKDEFSFEREIRAFIWTRKTRIVSLTDYLKPYLPEGTILTEATDVSADGSVVVGSGILKSGMHCLWRAYLPEFKSGEIKFGAGEIGSDKLSMKPTQAEAN